VFDPERDEDHTARRFYLRLLAVVVISAAACAALWPSVSGFAAGEDHQTGCVAIRDGWHADRSGPSAAERSAILATYPAPLTEAERNDPVAMARFRAQLQAAEASPAWQHEVAYEDWVAGAGQCVHESRHRLILSGLGLGGIGLVVGGIALFRRTRTSLRPSDAQVATA